MFHRILCPKLRTQFVFTTYNVGRLNMIYSNFPEALGATYSSSMTPRIIIGDKSMKKEYFSIFSHAQQAIAPGLNPYLNLEFNRSANLSLKNYEGLKDWRNTEDPEWNIPGHLFLLLTADFSTCEKKRYTQDGAFHTLRHGGRPKLKLYMRINNVLSKKVVSPIGIYKVITDEPCILQITPPNPTQVSKAYLLIRDGVVLECTNEIPSPVRKKIVSWYGMDYDKFAEWEKLEWIPL